jgi:hypothetical protein
MTGTGPAATRRDEEEQSFDRSWTMVAAADGSGPDLNGLFGCLSPSETRRETRSHLQAIAVIVHAGRLHL